MYYSGYATLPGVEIINHSSPLDAVTESNADVLISKAIYLSAIVYRYSDGNETMY